MWELTFPRTVVTGEGALEYLKEVEGKRALIITDKVIHKLGYVDRVANYLNQVGLEVKVFDEVEPEPSVETIVEGAEFARNFSPDWLVGLGGGSCIDAAKAMWILYVNPDVEVGEINPFAKYRLRKKARLICIPTTSGTGADVTWAVMITDVPGERKMELPSREIVADIVVLDPEFPKSMPPRLVADSGLDAFSHAIEAYVSQWRNDFSDALVIKAIQIIFKYLRRAYENSGDNEAKEKMHNAATIAGIGFSNSQVGVAHALAHSLGAIFTIPHGRIVAVFLLCSIEYGAREAMERYADIARAVGIEARTDKEAVEKLVADIKRLYREVQQPSSLRELGINRKDLEKRLEDLVTRAANSTCTFMNPRVPDWEDTRKLFLYAFEGKEVDF